MAPNACPYRRKAKAAARRGRGLSAWVGAEAADRRVSPTKHGIEGLWQEVEFVRTLPYDDRDPKPTPLCGPTDAARLVRSMRHRVTEQSVVILADKEMRPLGMVAVGQGIGDTTPNSMATIGAAALALGAPNIIHVHNHPSLIARTGPPLRHDPTRPTWSDPNAKSINPSPQDWYVATQVRDSLAYAGLNLVDALVVGRDGSFASLVEGSRRAARRPKRPVGPLLEF